jgi:peptidyl-prolyl cis-trans isomerase A (cyclophilin A)
MAAALGILAASGCSSGSSFKVESTESSRTPAVSTTAPEAYKVRLTTTKGAFDIDVHRDWAPRGADRFYELVQKKFYDDASFFRVLKGFAAQFGINKDPSVTQLWNDMKIIDDPAKQRNTRGTVSFAIRGPNSRTTQVFVNLVDNKTLDSSGFAPFGTISDEGMEVVDKLYGGYGEMIPRGNGPDPMKIQAIGNEYLERNFPKLDYIKTARVVE